jgi:2-oxoglutarate ferredoxin oxidoreductase subunit beta
LTVIFINNAIYGMTGGQMAPTTMPNQRTTTSPFGRDVEDTGHPLRVSEMLAALETPAFIARGAVHDPKQTIKTKKFVKKAFEYQRDDVCFSLIEILSTCPTNWGLSPSESETWLEDTMIPYYPLGIVKEPAKKEKATPAPSEGVPSAT